MTVTRAVLIVDDNDLVRNLIVAILDEAGIRSLTAASGEEALALAGDRDNDIGCVLQDMSLPGMPGEEIAAALLQLEPSLPIIILSVDDAGYNSSRLAGLAIADYVQKPFDTDALITKVRGLIR